MSATDAYSQRSIAADGCLRPLEQATSLPLAAFNNPTRYNAERTQLFHSGWVAVARSSELDPSSLD